MGAAFNVGGNACDGICHMIDVAAVILADLGHREVAASETGNRVRAHGPRRERAQVASTHSIQMYASGTMLAHSLGEIDAPLGR